MANDNAPETGTPEVSSEESFEQYEARYLKAQEGEQDASDADEEEKPASKTASDSETEEEEPETEEEPSEDEDEEEKPKKSKGGFQRRIDKLSGRIKELETQLAAKPAGDATEEKPQPTGKPKLEDFDSVEDYTESRIAWELDERARKAEADKVMDSWREREKVAKKTHADYDDVLAEVEDVKLTPAHQKLFLDSEHGAELAYQLAGDRKQLEQFAALDPLAAGRMFGRLEASLSAQTLPKKPVTRAPKPPSKVAGGKVATPTADDIANDYNAWEKVRNRELQQQRRGW